MCIPSYRFSSDFLKPVNKKLKVCDYTPEEVVEVWVNR